MFAGLLAYSRASIDEDPFFAPAAATLLTLSLFAHFSATLVVGAVGISLLLGLVDDRRPQLAFVMPLVVGGTLAAWYFGTTLNEYLDRPWGILRRAGPVHITSMIAGVVALAGILWAVQQERLRLTMRTWLPWLLLTGLTAVATYAYFFRTQGPGLAVHDAEALREFARVYISPFGLATAMVGLAVLVCRSFWRGLAFVTIAAVFSCFIFYKMRITPEHFWLARRYVPVILPAACLLMGTAISFPTSVGLPPGLDRRAARVGLRLPGVAVLLLILIQFFSATQPILGYVEYAGVIPRLEALEAMFEDDDLVIIEARDASDLHTLAVPLAYVYARNVLLLVARNPDPEAFGEFLTWARGRYRRVLFVGGGGSQVLSRSTTALPVTSEQFRVPEYERSYPTIPQEIRLKQYDVGIYELVPRLGTTGPLDLDVGGMDDLYVAAFHSKETLGDQPISFRWTREASFVMIPYVGDEVRTMTLWLSAGGRPRDLPAPRVEVFLANRLLGMVTVTEGFQPYAFNIAPDHAREIGGSDEPVQVSIASNTWSPSAALDADDTRNLGVMVDRLVLE